MEKKEGKYYSDKATFESPDFRAYCNKNYGGLPKELSLLGLKYYRVEQKNYLRWIKEKEKVSEEKEEKKFGEIYEEIIKILKKYCDLREDYYSLISIWVIGTYLHKQFSTYPYLFFNAMKGSGKTRLLNLLSHLCCNGKLLVSLSEAVLFRTASQSSFFIDEFENVGKKEKGALRELLNVGYKKGMYVERAKKVSDNKGEENYKIERYNLFCPIAMANIWGMENVLADRCIILTLERSQNPTLTRIIEDFGNSEAIKKVKKELGSVSRVLGIKKTSYWNEYVLDLSKKDNSYNNNTINTINTINTTNLFNKIYATGINSRHLELFFPLFIVSDLCGEVALGRVLETSKKIVNEKKESDIDESNDVMLFSFISELEDIEFIKIKDLTQKFKFYYSEEEQENKWINSKWLGRALKRLVLIKDKRRINGKSEVMLDIKKAKEKSKLFKSEKQENKKIERFTKDEIKKSGLPEELINKTIDEIENDKKIKN